MPVISVIVPVYNAEKYLRESLDSIVNQTYKNIEIILVDDGSTDGSSAICDEYADKDVRIKVYHIPNGGVSNARNLGINNANGEYLMFVDSDDIILPYVVERAIKLALEHNADIVYGLVKVFDTSLCLPKELSDESNVLSDKRRINLAQNMFDLHDKGFQTMHGYISRGPVARLVRSSLAQKYLFHKDIVLGEDGVWNIELLGSMPKSVIDFNLWYGYRRLMESASHKYRLTAKQDYTNMMAKHLILAERINAGEFCFNRAWESIMGLCDAYYLHSEYSNTITFATKDLGNLLKQYPWNRIFNLKCASRAGLKGIVKWLIIKLNLALKFKIFKNKLKNSGGGKTLR